LEATYCVPNYAKVEKAGICSECSFKLYQEMATVFWKWHTVAAEEEMTRADLGNHEVSTNTDEKKENLVELPGT